MKTIFSALAILSLSAGIAVAADLPSTKAPPPPPVVVLPPTWTGIYVGVNGGYGWNGRGPNITTTNIANQAFLTSQGFAPSGAFFGGQVGYNYQISDIVVGVESDFQKSYVRDSFTPTIVATGGNPFLVQARQSFDYFGTIRGRLGYAFGPVLLYGTGGFAYGKVSTQHLQSNATLGYAVPLQQANQKVGYAVGGGVEYKFTRNWSVKAEYQYIDLGHQNLQTLFRVAGAPVPGNLVVSNAIPAAFNTVRVGLNYAF